MKLNSSLLYEKVSNNNGTCYKYADGTMICAMITKVTTTITTGWGGIYIGGIFNMGKYPVEFKETPIVSISVTNNTGDGAWYMNGSADLKPDKKHAGSYYLCRGASLNSAKEFIFNIIAIGKWK